MIQTALAMLVFLGAYEKVLAEEGPLVASYLRCEYRMDPLGIDAKEPRLSWVVESAQRAQRQTAYQVLVAAAEETLRQDRGDLWDSGKVAGDGTTAIVYQGKPLVSGVRCFWKVKVWDKNDRPSAWSTSASWSMGLLEPGDWKAQWIGYRKARQVEETEAPLDGAKWIWHAADPHPQTPRGHRVFLSTLPLPQDAKVVKAELLATAEKTYVFRLNGSRILANRGNVPEDWKAVSKANVMSLVHPGDNQLYVDVDFNPPGSAGFIAKLTVTTADGRTITHVTDGTWKSSDRGRSSLARVIGDYGCQPWGRLKLRQLFLTPAPFLRTVFRAEKPVRTATLYASALGIFDLHLNGALVAEDYFNPGWTNYGGRVYYRAYDVTSRIRQGENVLGAVLADGWYSGYVGWFGPCCFGKFPQFRGQLVIETTDGARQVVSSGPGWKATTGPIREADLLMGETYDARLELRGWSQPGFDDSTWDAVMLMDNNLHRKVQSHPGPAVRAYEEFHAKTIREPRRGIYVVDLGQNFAGIVRLKVKGTPGQTITLRYAERLNPDGTVYTLNLRSARATDTYICRGEGAEIWQPRFTFHGFQYVELTGLSQPPTTDTVVGIALSSETPSAGRFKCSDAMLNRLRQNIYYTQRSNFIDIPTDCPQRDERLGWAGDAQVYVRTATLNTDVQAFFTKWLVDLDDAQRPDGEIRGHFPQFAPMVVGCGGDGGPAWADAGVICPWTIYEAYGDCRVLQQHYASMQRYIDFCQRRSTPEMLPPEKFHCFGDWLSIKANTPKEVICTAYFAYSTRLTARAAEALGKTEDATRYRELFEKIKASFNRAYVAEDGRIKGDTQCCYVLALAFDLLDEKKQELAAKYLIEDIEKCDWHLSTGFIGTKDLMLVLSKIGRNDVAYRLLHNDTFPSWGFSIKHGATSIWERWDGWTPEKGFQDPGMNSFAHYSFGAVYQWIVENVGGIRTDGPAYKRIVIAPQPGGRLTWAKVGYRSIRGPIDSDWKLDAGRLLMDVTIPPGATATVRVPAAKAADVTEGGQTLNAVEGLKFLRMDSGRAVLAVESGTYHFVSSSP